MALFRHRNYKHEWTWEENQLSRNVVLSAKNSIVTFHPKNSRGTAVVRGNQPFEKNRYYYWEVRMLTQPYGTDVMIGVGTKKVDMRDSSDGSYCSLLGINKESWGLSYLGLLQHNGIKKEYASYWSMGNTVGVYLDTWRGTLQFFINKQPFGVAFTGLRDYELYPMACSTAAVSKMKIVQCISEPVSLQIECMSMLKPFEKEYIETSFPFLKYLSRSVFADLVRKQLYNDDEEIDTHENDKSNLKLNYVEQMN